MSKLNELPVITISSYTYDLPPDRIAQYPLEERDSSKLLIRHGKEISNDIFRNLVSYLPDQSLLIFNDTRVVRARLLFPKPSGSVIEIFCLEPLKPTREIQLAFQQQAGCTWKCLIGNAKRWKSGTLEKTWVIEGENHHLLASREGDAEDGIFAVELRWKPSRLTFGELLERAGQVPLPPYIIRNVDPVDIERYQTIYARIDGSVAAPTAGLHFTENVMESIHARPIHTTRVTLHVGLGTFRPMTTSNIHDHVMHSEHFLVSRATIYTLLESLGQPVICVGTTSVRTIESLYWLGVQLLRNQPGQPFKIGQWDPYLQTSKYDIPVEESLLALINYLDKRNMSHIEGETQLLIMPGYQFTLVSGLITNFHQPQSSLLLLIAAFLGDDWKTVYQYALDHDFRFLSYGDACLFL